MGRSARRALGAAVAAVALACGRETSPRATGAAAACPGRDFRAFLAAFADDTAVQARFTRFPLEEVSVDNTGSEPRTVKARTARAAARFPLMPSRARWAADSLQARVESRPDGRIVVDLRVADTDYQLAYRFEPEGGCWRLTRTEDWSL